MFETLNKADQEFDYLYLCTHGDADGFEIDMGHGSIIMTWSEFSGILCENGILTNDAIILLACCKGGLFKVTSELMAACYSINYVCGVKWSVRAWDLTTGFLVFLYCMEVKESEPMYAPKKATDATDYTFVCYERTEIESNPQYQNIKNDLFRKLGWTDDHGIWIEEDEQIKKNVRIERLQLPTKCIR